jgi:branched-chain amino acid transport system substrate-binding protein
MVPVLNSTQGGPLPIVSMGTTYLGLTRKGHGVATGDPENLYPTGTRNYARMAPADDAQAAAAALYAQGLGVQRPYVLHHDDAWGIRARSRAGRGGRRDGRTAPPQAAVPGGNALTA